MGLNRVSVIVLGVVIAAGSSIALDDPVSGAPSPETLVEVRHTAIPFDNGGKRVPNWSGGALVLVDNTNWALPVIHAFGGDGALLARVPFAISGASRIVARQFKRAADGTLAVVGSAYTADSRGAKYLAVISGDGKRQQIIRLDPFFPYEVAVAPDGTYWVAGEELVNGREVPNHNMIRHFSVSGGELGAYIPRSNLTSYRYGHPADDSFLVSSQDRIGWYSNTAGAYMEFALDGRVLTHVAGLPLEHPSRVDGVGLCDNGGVFVSAWLISGEERRSEIFTLDRVSGAWKPVPRDGDSAAVRYRPVYGCEGNDIVTRRRLPDELLGLSWLRPVRAR